MRGNREEMKLEVVCYAGMKADERPVRFRLDGKEYLVEEILDQWYGPDTAFFKISADDGNLYILSRETSVTEGLWDLVSFRQWPGQCQPEPENPKECYDSHWIRITLRGVLTCLSSTTKGFCSPHIPISTHRWDESGSLIPESEGSGCPARRTVSFQPGSRHTAR
jgi:hypothetical protein